MARVTTDFLRAFKKAFSLPWRIWGRIIIFFNFIGPLPFLMHTEAQLTLAVNVIQAAVMMVIFRKLGFVRLMGVAHYGWFALIPYLILQLQGASDIGPFEVWLAALIVVDAISLIIDVTDMFRYIAGDRAPIGQARPAK